MLNPLASIIISKLYCSLVGIPKNPAAKFCAVWIILAFDSVLNTGNVVVNELSKWPMKKKSLLISDCIESERKEKRIEIYHIKF